MDNQNEKAVRPFGRLVATKLALETITLGEKGHFMSPQSASLVNDLSDLSDPITLGG